MTIKKDIKNLINKMEAKSSKDDLEIVQDFIIESAKYVNSVIAMESAISVARFRMEPDEYQNYLVNLDRTRKLNHDALIITVKVLNKLCRLYDLAPIYQGSDSRIEIAEFAKKVVDEYFDDRKKAR